MLAQNAGGDSHLSRQELSAAIYGLASKCRLVGTGSNPETGLEEINLVTGYWKLCLEAAIKQKSKNVS
jgi:hypothetical protein